MSQKLSTAQSSKSSVPYPGLFYLDQTALGLFAVEVLRAKRSDCLGTPDCRVIYWKKGRSLLLEDGLLFKLALPEFKRSRFGADLSRLRLDSLEGFETLVVGSKLVLTRQTISFRRNEV